MAIFRSHAPFAALVVLASLSPLVLAQNAPDIPFPACPDGQELLFSTDWGSNVTENYGVSIASSFSGILAQQDGVELNVLGPACLYDEDFDLEIQGLPALTNLSMYTQWIFRGTWDSNQGGVADTVLFSWGPDVSNLDETFRTTVTNFGSYSICLPNAFPCGADSFIPVNHPSPDYHHEWFRGSGQYDRMTLWESWKVWENPKSLNWLTRIQGEDLEAPCDNEDLAVRHVLVCGTLDVLDIPNDGLNPLITIGALAVGGLILAGAIAGFLLRDSNSSDDDSSSYKKGGDAPSRVMSGETSMTTSSGATLATNSSGGASDDRASQGFFKDYSAVPIHSFKPKDDDMMTVQTQYSTTSDMAPFF